MDDGGSKYLQWLVREKYKFTDSGEIFHITILAKIDAVLTQGHECLKTADAAKNRFLSAADTFRGVRLHWKQLDGNESTSSLTWPFVAISTVF